MRKTLVALALLTPLLAGCGSAPEVQPAASVAIPADSANTASAAQLDFKPVAKVRSDDGAYEFIVGKPLGVPSATDCSVVPDGDTCKYQMVELKTGHALYQAGFSGWADYANWGNPVQVLNSKTILNKSYFGDAGAAETKYATFDLVTKQTTPVWKLSTYNGFITSVDYDGKSFFFDNSQTNKLKIYEVISQDGHFYTDPTSMPSGWQDVQLDAKALALKVELNQAGELKIDDSRWGGIYFQLGTKKYQFLSTNFKIKELS